LTSTKGWGSIYADRRSAGLEGSAVPFDEVVKPTDDAELLR
jgi:hypothetical protein